MRFLPLPLLIASTLLLGCRTVSNMTLVNTVAVLAGQAARLGALAQIKNQPADRAFFEASKVGLDGFLNSRDYDPAHLQTILASLPINTFKGDNGALVIEGAVLVYSVVTATFFDVQSAPAVQAIATAIRDGFAAALQATAPAPAVVPSLGAAAKRSFAVPAAIPVDYELKPVRWVTL